MATQNTSNQISNSAAQRIESALLELRELVIAGFATMNDRFDRLEARVDRLEAQQAETNLRLNKLESRMAAQEAAQRETNTRITAQESAQRETNIRLGRIEGQNEALYNDIKALYHELAKLKKKHGPELAKNRELLARVRKVEVFAREVSVQTGIPYEGI